MAELNRFNWIARKYDSLVSVIFGEQLQMAQMHFVGQLNETNTVLILGGGTGKFLTALLEARPSLTITYIDAASEMILLARQNIQGNRNVTFIHGTEKEIPAKQFDAVITNFFLDLFQQQEVDMVLNRIEQHLVPGGKWLVTDFQKSQRIRHRILLSVMYFFFKITGSISAKALPEWRSFFKLKKFQLLEEKEFYNGFIKSQVFVKPSK